MTTTKFWAKFTDTRTQQTLFETTDPDAYVAKAKELGYDKKASANRKWYRCWSEAALKGKPKPVTLSKVEKDWLGVPVYYRRANGVVWSMAPRPHYVWVYFPDRVDADGQPDPWSELHTSTLVPTGPSQRFPVEYGAI